MTQLSSMDIGFANTHADFKIIYTHALVGCMIKADEFDVVVIDAANVVHHHGYDDEENLIQSIFPERLESCVDFFQEMGWEVRAFLKQGTYWWAVKNKEMATIGDVRIFETLRRQGILEIVSSEQDDMFWIDYAIENNGLVITRDKLKSEKEEYERDWDAVENRIMRDWEVLETGEFLAPLIPMKEGAERMTFKTLKSRLKELEMRVAELEKSDSPMGRALQDNDEPEEKSTEIEQETVRAITNEVVRRLLSPGEFIHLTRVYHALASVHLQLEAGNLKNWPQDWRDQLMSLLDVSGKMSVWVKEICPFDVELSPNNQNIRKASREDNR